MYPDYDRKNNASSKVATLAVVAIGIMALLAPPYLLSSAQEAFATTSYDDDTTTNPMMKGTMSQ
jgi:hypothetical protein